MKPIPSMVDLARSPEEMKENANPIADMPIYPWGLSISMDEGTLEKLGVDYSDWAVGDVFPADILMKITSISSNETESGNRCRVELQITHMSGESDEEEEPSPLRRRPSIYKMG